MKIDSGTIHMNSGRFYANSTEITQETLSTQVSTGAFSYSGTSFLSTYAQYNGSQTANPASGQYDEYVNSMTSPDAPVSDLYTNLLDSRTRIRDSKSTLEQFHEEFVKRIEEFMERIKAQLLGLYQQNANHYVLSGDRFPTTDAGDSSILDLTTGSQPGSFWTRKNYQRVTYSETETTCFTSTGCVKTSDGRSIDFNISIEMSHSFTETSEMLSSDTQYILTDPLVIQLEDVPKSISDQKWFFDIDGDGKKEEISALVKGNGFLALDANDNGKIDDGSELFGTRSGNGFKDLATYDEDGNGWIDENDSVYSKLKIWVKDSSGNDKLLDLKQADIGAIYLGATATEFSEKSEDTNELQAMIRQTGIYLHESGSYAGTIQQIDFVKK